MRDTKYHMDIQFHQSNTKLTMQWQKKDNNVKKNNVKQNLM